MNKQAVFHMSSGLFSYAISGDTLSVRLKVGKGSVKKVNVYYQNVYDHSENRKKQNMEKILSDDLWEIYEGSLTVKEKHFKL